MSHPYFRCPMSNQPIRLKAVLIILVYCVFAVKECSGQDSLYPCSIITAVFKNKFASTVLRLDRSPDPSIRFLDRLQQLKECSIDSTFGKPVVIFEGPFDSTFRRRQMDISITLVKSKDVIQIHYQQLGTGQVGSIYLKRKGSRFKIVKWHHILY
jgi:hypothetical protein